MLPQRPGLRLFMGQNFESFDQCRPGVSGINNSIDHQILGDCSLKMSVWRTDRDSDIAQERTEAVKGLG
jgi:hypothetical protein